MKLLNSTDKSYNCVHCGSGNIQVIRNDSKTGNSKLKCSDCNFLFTSEDAESAKKAGAIPASSPEALAKASDPEIEVHKLPTTARTIDVPKFEKDLKAPQLLAFTTNKIPRTPTYVFVSKDRTRVEFCNSKEVKKLALKWEQGGSYDVYELSPKQFDVKVDIS